MYEKSRAQILRGVQKVGCESYGPNPVF